MDKQVYEFISKQTNDPIVERRICKRTGQEFAIFQSQKELEKTLGNISPQEISHENVMRQLMMFRNERKLYKNISKKSGKPIITIYPSDFSDIVYNKDERREEDFIREDTTPIHIENIESEFERLNSKIPKQALVINNNENVEYANYVDGCKNVYMSFLIYYGSEDVYNSYRIVEGKNIVDSFDVKNKSEVIYNSINISESSSVFDSMNIENSYNIYFSYGLKNCKNCIFCNNLVNKTYCIHNQQYTKEEYQKKSEEIIKEMRKYTSYKKILQEYMQVLKRSIYKSLNTKNCELSVGNNMTDCNKTKFGVSVRDANNAINVRGEHVKNVFNFIGGSVENCANASRTGRGNKCLGTFNALHSNNIFHSIDIYNSEYMLFCRGLKNKKYCILNQQYTKEEFEYYKEKIKKRLQEKGKRGHFFDVSVSPFPYNDTVANDYFPIKKEQLTILEPEKFISDAILDFGGKEKIKIKWRNKENEINIPEGAQIIKGQEIQDSIVEASDDILKKVIICEISGRPFRIIKPELDFYRKHTIPLPRKHPDIRHEERLSMIPKRQLHLRDCDKCNIEMLSVYSGDFKGKVYCESCYNKEIYG